MLKWIAFLSLLAVSVGIFVFAPMALVSYFIALFVPAGMESVGTTFSLGLTLSIVANSFLSRWKSMRVSLIFLVILSIAEAMMSGATLYLKALADNRLDLVVGLGILAVVVARETGLITGGFGISIVLERIEIELGWADAEVIVHRRWNGREGVIIRRELVEKFGERCAACGSTQSLEIDHVIPLSWGGTNEMDNLQLLCRSCNAKKKNFSAADYRRQGILI